MWINKNLVHQVGDQTKVISEVHIGILTQEAREYYMVRAVWCLHLAKYY
jgi:hypothetical protein